MGERTHYCNRVYERVGTEMKLLRIVASDNGGTCLISAKALAAKHGGCIATATQTDDDGRQIIKVIGRYGRTCVRDVGG